MTILAALADYHDRLAETGALAPPGYGPAKISFAVPITADGALAGPATPLLQDGAGGKGKPRPQERDVPGPVKRTSGVASNFLWEKTAYALGVGASKRLEAEHAAFRDLHREALAEAAAPGLKALARFVEQWRPEMWEALGLDESFLNANLVFRLIDEQRFVHESAEAARIWQAMNAPDGDAAPCLVTGVPGPAARLHPAIKGVFGAQSSGAALVSFNLGAFESYGKKQGGNAPVSAVAAEAYGKALNHLLARDSGRSLRIGDATAVFWADAKDAASAEAAENALQALLAPPAEAKDAAADAAAAAPVRHWLEAVAMGRPLAEAAPDIDPGTRVFILGLSPNNARLAVRFWHVDRFDRLYAAIGRHYRDLHIEPSPFRRPPAAWALLAETAAQGKLENVPPIYAGQLMRAILTGGPYPRSLLAAVVMRIRADKAVNGRRAAICKACLCRTPTPTEEDLVSLNETSDDLAYNLGRLFAAYAYAERSLVERGASLRDKYMGAASSTPRRVFPLLMRGYEHNRSGLAKAGQPKADYGRKAERAVAQILSLYDGDVPMPTTLPMEDQARFFIGFYHQDRYFYASPDAATHTPEEAPAHD